MAKKGRRFGGKNRNEPHDVFKQVDMKGKTEDDCWPYTGYLRTDPQGFKRGIFALDGKKLYAHRVVWECYNGRSLAPGEVVRHECDNTVCCNPKHLLVGVQKDNVKDMLERERVGEKHAFIQKIMQLLETGASADSVAAHMYMKYDVQYDASVIRKIRNRRIYKHIPWEWGDKRLAEKLAKLASDGSSDSIEGSEE